MEAINLITFFTIYLFARLGMKLLWVGLFGEEECFTNNTANIKT